MATRRNARNRKLKTWIAIIIVIYALIITMAFCYVLIFKNKNAAKAKVVEESSTSQSSYSDSMKELTLEEQAEYMALHAAEYVENIDEYRQYIKDRQKSEDLVEKLLVISSAATDDSKLKSVDVGENGYTYSWDGKDKPVVSIWQVNVNGVDEYNIVLKNTDDENEWVRLLLKPTEEVDVRNDRVVCKLAAACGKAYEHVYECDVSTDLLQHPTELQRKIAYLALK